VGSREDSDSKEITEEVEEEEAAITRGIKDSLNVVANGCEKKAIKEDARGKFIKANGSESAP
jgi:hypothetical protein